MSKFVIIPNQQTPRVDYINDVPKFINEHHDELNGFLCFSRSVVDAAALSANQVSVDGKRLMYRVFAFCPVFKCKLIIDPKIEEYIGEKKLVHEQCLSYKCKRLTAYRYPKIKVSYWTLDGEHIDGEIISGYKAEIWQHELDHLNGVKQHISDMHIVEKGICKAEDVSFRDGGEIKAKGKIINKKKFNNGGEVLLDPNGNISLLNDQQWKLTRSIPFTNWFGNWIKNNRIQEISSMEPIVIDEDKEVDQFHTNTEVVHYIFTKSSGSISHKNFDSEIHIAMNGIKHIMHHDARNIYKYILHQIKKIINNAIVIESSENYDAIKRQDNPYFHYLFCPIIYNGNDYSVYIDIKQTTRPERKYLLYDITVFHKKITELISESRLSKPNAKINSEILYNKYTKLNYIFQANDINLSKIVDANNEPLILWHGTDYQFNTFKKGEFGFHFGSKEQALKRGSKVKPYFLNIKRLLRFDYDLGNFSDFDMWKEYAYAFEGEPLEEIINKANSIEELKDGIKELYDGIIYENRFESENLDQFSYIALYPNQIKLADGTNTTFDMENNDIRFKDGGKVKIRAKGKTIAKPQKPKYKGKIIKKKSRNARIKAVIGELNHDHHDTFEFADKLSKTTDANVEQNSIALIERWYGHMKNHFNEEEKNLFPMIKDGSNDYMIAEILREHKELESVIDRVENGGNVTPDVLINFGNKVKGHIQKEDALFLKYAKNKYMKCQTNENVKKDGGSVETNDGKQGGLLVGKRHSECDENGCGIKATVTDSGGTRDVELEADEAIVTRPAMIDENVYVIEGTPAQIVSQTNHEIGKGVLIEEGGKILSAKTPDGKKLSIPKMKQGGRFEDKLAIATEIQNQIGHKAFYMLGAYNLVGDKDSLQFKIRGSKAYNHIKVTLNSNDLYDVAFVKIWNYQVIREKVIKDVGVERLHSVIEKRRDCTLN